jgi:hypothetical protein
VKILTLAFLFFALVACRNSDYTGADIAAMVSSCKTACGDAGVARVVAPTFAGKRTDINGATQESYTCVCNPPVPAPLPAEAPPVTP